MLNKVLELPDGTKLQVLGTGEGQSFLRYERASDIESFQMLPENTEISLNG